MFNHTQKSENSYIPLISQLHEKLNELEAENKLIQEHFKKTFHESGIGMAILELDGSFREVNIKLAQIFGYTRAQLQGGMTFHDLMDTESIRKDSGELLDLLAGKISSYQTYKRGLDKDGAIIPLVLNVSLIKGAYGEPLYFVMQLIPVNDIANLASYFEQRG